MINLEDETVDVIDESYTKDEIVAKLLGWMQGSVRLKCVHMNQFDSGIIAKHLPHMPMLIFPVMEQLDAIRHEAQEEVAARIRKLEAENANDALVPLFAESDVADAEYIALRNRANQFIRDVKDEIDNDDASVFEEYPPYPDNPNEPRYTTGSVEKWSLKKYGLSVIDFANSDALEKQFKTQLMQVEKIAPLPSLKIRKRRHDALSEELEVILNEMQKPTATKVMAVLRGRVGIKGTCITTDDGDSIRFESYNSKVKPLTINALDRRIGTWRKHRLSTG